MAKKDENIYVLYPSWNGNNGEFPQGEKDGKKNLIIFCSCQPSYKFPLRDCIEKANCSRKVY